MKSSFNKVFKIVVLTTDSALLEKTKEQQLQIVEDYVETSGAFFGAANLKLNQQMVVAQYWMLEPEKQWETVRNLYYHGTSGIIILYDPSTENGISILQKQIREFIGVNKGKLVPFLILGVNLDGKVSSSALAEQTHTLATDFIRWSGQDITYLTVDASINLNNTLADFIAEVHIWRARNAVSTTLQMYFALDAIANTKRSIKQIVSQLRKLYVSHRYALLSDDELISLIKEEAATALFMTDAEHIIYTKLS